MSSLVAVTVAEGIATLRLDRVDKRNALSADLMTAIAAALDGIRDDADEAVSLLVDQIGDVVDVVDVPFEDVPPTLTGPASAPRPPSSIPATSRCPSRSSRRSSCW